jgi:hypothetical protein
MYIVQAVQNTNIHSIGNQLHLNKNQTTTSPYVMYVWKILKSVHILINPTIYIIVL